MCIRDRYRPCVVAVLNELESGSIKRLEAAPSAGRKSPRQSAKAAFDRAEPVKSAFALLSTKVTKEGLAPILPELLTFGKVP